MDRAFMNNTRRHKFDIIAEILQRSTRDIKKTQLVFLSNTNFTLINRYLEPLMAKDFIQLSGGLYFTTPTGYEFLNMYDTLMDIWKNGGEK